MPVLAFLLGHLGLPENAVERVQTVFLNGSAVDDLENTLVTPDSQLSLSAAMPGVLGATLRRGGYYARLREGITQGEQDTPQAADAFALRMRLFNLTGRELAPYLLNHGILLERQALLNFLDREPRAFWDACHDGQLDEKPIATDGYRPEDWESCRPWEQLRVVPPQ